MKKSLVDLRESIFYRGFLIDEYAGDYFTTEEAQNGCR